MDETEVDESLYFEKRAGHALDLAQQAVHPAVARAHYQLAELYLERMIDCRNPPAPRKQVPAEQWAVADEG